MTDFHRLENPPADYVTGGGTLPAGYDYINNDPTSASGSASGERAVANSGPKVSGFNSGTYFLAWRDSGLSANVNRPLEALAENTDHLDNLLRRRQAVPKSVAVVTLGGETYIQISDWVWCGDNVADPPYMLVQALESDGFSEATFESGGFRYQTSVTDIKDSTGAVSVVGSGWVENPRVYIGLGASPQNLLLVYGSRSSPASHHPGALTELHAFYSAPFKLQELLWYIKGGTSFSSVWSAAPPSNLFDLRAKTLNHSYRAWDSDGGGTPGAGAVITRDSTAVTVESGIARTYADSINACWKAVMRDTANAFFDSRLSWGYGSSGFVSQGTRWDIQGKKDFTPSFASFLAFESQYGTSRPASVSGHKYLTNLPENAAGTLTPVGDGLFTLELSGSGVYPDPYFYCDSDGLGDYKTAIKAKKDILEITLTGGEKRSFVVFALYAGQATAPISSASSVKKAVLYPLDAGMMEDIVAADAGVSVVWHATQFGVGYGAGASKVAYDGTTSAFGAGAFTDFGLEGMFLADPTPKTNSMVDGDDFYGLTPGQPLLTLGGASASRKLISVGEFNPLPETAGYTENAYVQADGEAKVSVLKLRRSEKIWVNISVALTTTVSANDGSYFIFDNPAISSGITKFLAITDLTTGADNQQEIYIRIYRSTNAVLRFEPSATGFTNIISAEDTVLSPVGFGSTGNWYDLYIGRVINDKVFWTVERCKV